MSDGNEFSDVCAARFNDPSDKDIRKSFSADGPADLLALDRLIAGSIELEQRLANVTELHAAMLDREYVATKFLGGTQENSFPESLRLISQVFVIVHFVAIPGWRNQLRRARKIPRKF